MWSQPLADPVRNLRFRTGSRSRNCHGFWRCSRNPAQIRCLRDKSCTGAQSRNCRWFLRCRCSYSRIRCRFEIFRFRTGAQSRNSRWFLRCSRSYSRIRCRFEIFRFRNGAQSRNCRWFLRCSRSPSRIQGSVPVLALQLNEFSRSLLVCARTHPPISTHTKVRVSFCLLGKWYGKVVFYSRWDEVANSD